MVSCCWEGVEGELFDLLEEAHGEGAEVDALLLDLSRTRDAWEMALVVDEGLQLFQGTSAHSPSAKT